MKLDFKNKPFESYGQVCYYIFYLAIGLSVFRLLVRL